jgi:hypothetical protein
MGRSVFQEEKMTIKCLSGRDSLEGYRITNIEVGKQFRRLLPHNT